MATSHLLDTTRNSILTTLNTALGNSANIYIFSGAPAGKTGGSFNADPTGTLVVLPLGATGALNTPSSGAATVVGTPSATATGTGTPATARFKTSANAVIWEIDCAVGSGSINFGSTIASGGTVTLSSFTVTEGDA